MASSLNLTAGQLIPPRPPLPVPVPTGTGRLLEFFEQFQPGDPAYEAAQRARQYAAQADNAATKRAYATDWRLFTEWCASRSLPVFPSTPEVVAMYISDMAASGKIKSATITKKLAAISKVHEWGGFPSPSTMQNPNLQTVARGIRKSLGTKQAAKDPISLELIRRMIDNEDGVPLAIARNRALILVGFATGMRRSELAALQVEHLHERNSGFQIEVPRSKTDQEGKGREVEIVYGSQPEDTSPAILTCPVRALKRWLLQAAIGKGPVFRKVNKYGEKEAKALHPDSIGWIIKQSLSRAGVRPQQLWRYGAHSLRAGFATTAYQNGVPELKIRKQTGHQSARMLERYIRGVDKARQEAAGSLGL